MAAERYADLETALRMRGEFICPIRGTSMMPMLDQQRDAVRLVFCDGEVERLRKGDLPLYRGAGGELILHRIIGLERGGYRICGDNCTAIEHVPFEAVIGRAVGYFKDGVYVPMEDGGYLRYVRRVMRGRPLRRLKQALRSRIGRK